MAPFIVEYIFESWVQLIIGRYWIPVAEDLFDIRKDEVIKDFTKEQMETYRKHRTEYLKRYDQANYDNKLDVGVDHTFDETVPW